MKMDLTKQKIEFFKTTKGIKALDFCKKWFKDFSSIKLEPLFLQNFYSNERYNGAVPLSAEADFFDYELLFWFWFYQRYSRLQTEKDIFLQNKQYEKELEEIEANNPLNFLSKILTEGSNLILTIAGLYVAYKLFKMNDAKR